MNILNSNDTLFLTIDIQEKLLNSTFNRDTLEKNAKILTSTAKTLDIPVIITEQYPQGLGETINSVKSVLQNATFFEKVTFNALEDKNLIQAIEATGRKQIIVLGIETHICVHQTVASLLSNNYNVTVAKDACGSRSEFQYNSGLDIMKSNGANIKTTEMIIFELLKTAKHPNFKEIQALIK